MVDLCFITGLILGVCFLFMGLTTFIYESKLSKGTKIAVIIAATIVSVLIAFILSTYTFRI
jgi:hypothetical protein